MPRLTGDFTDEGVLVDVSEVDLHESEAVFAGALTLVHDHLRVGLRGFSFATEGATTADEAFTLGGVTVAAGDHFVSGFSWWSAGAEVSYEIDRPYWNATNDTDLSLFVLTSLDVHSISRDLGDSTTGQSTSAHEPFFTLNVGGGFRLGFDTKSTFPLLRRIEISGEAAVGAAVPAGDGEIGVSTDVEAQCTGWLSNTAAIYFGYRRVGVSFDGEELSLTASLQGLRAGFRYEF